MPVDVIEQRLSGRRLDLSVQMVTNAADLLDRGLLMLMRLTHRRSPPEDSGFQGPDTRASSLPR